MTNSSVTNTTDRVFRVLCASCAVLPVVGAAWFVIATLVRGFPHLLAIAWPGPELIELLLELRLVGVASALAIPAGIAAAIYLEQLAAPGSFTTLARRSLHLLTAVPSVLYGLCGFTVLVVCLDHRVDFNVRAYCLALCLFPIVVERTQNALRTVSPLVREASLALGADPFRTLVHVMMPLALPALASEMLVVLARALGTVAPLLVVDAFRQRPVTKLDVQFVPLTERIFRSGTRPELLHQQWAAGVVLTLLCMLILLHAFSSWLSKRRMTDGSRTVRDGLSERGTA